MIRTVSIGQVADINPATPRSLVASPDRIVSFVPMADVTEAGSVVARQERPVGEVLKGFTYFETGDVLLAKITPCLENGKAAYVRDLPHGVGFGSTEFHVLRPGPDVDGQYLFYMIWNDQFRHKAEQNMTGSAGQKRVPKDFVSRFQIPLPPLAEQRRIADILDKADAIRRKSELTRMLVRSAVRAYFFELFGDPVRNTKRWATETLGDVVAMDRGRSRHRPRDAAFLYGGPYPLIQTGDIANAEDGYVTKYSQTYSEAGLEQSRLWPKGTLCITIAANIAKTAILTFDACFPDSVVGVAPGSNVTTEYLRYWFVAMERAIEAEATQVAQKNINLEILRGLIIPVPPLHLQETFSKGITRFRIINQIISDRLVNSHSLFHSLVQRAFRGEL